MSRSRRIVELSPGEADALCRAARRWLHTAELGDEPHPVTAKALRRAIAAVEHPIPTVAVSQRR